MSNKIRIHPYINAETKRIIQKHFGDNLGHGIDKMAQQFDSDYISFQEIKVKLKKLCSEK